MARIDGRTALLGAPFGHLLMMELLLLSLVRASMKH